jgi:hypothetical protein
MRAPHKKFHCHSSSLTEFFSGLFSFPFPVQIAQSIYQPACCAASVPAQQYRAGKTVSIHSRLQARFPFHLKFLPLS